MAALLLAGGCITAAAETTPDFVQRFSPELRFDRAAQDYPMSAQTFYEVLKNYRYGAFRIENTDRATLATGAIPTYYQVRKTGNQVRINYWWFYGYQHPCYSIFSRDFGEHNGDWEHVTVFLKEDMSAVAAVSYYQHGGHYTRIAGPRDAPCTPGGSGRCGSARGFQSNGTHPVVYSGKYAHGSYHDANALTIPGPGECAYYGDYRNPASGADYLQTWRKLVDLDGSSEYWLADDRTGNWTWGPGGIGTHPTTHFPDDAEHSASCTGNTTYSVENDGCYQSECLAGDDETAFSCIKECRPGYINIGLVCRKKYGWPWEFYSRLNNANNYGYRYTIPTRDAGLIRRRGASDEWSLP